MSDQGNGVVGSAREEHRGVRKAKESMGKPDKARRVPQMARICNFG